MILYVEDAGQERLGIDTKLLSEAFIQLNILRKNLTLYPAEHPVRNDSLQTTHKHLLRLLEFRATITIGIAGDSLVIDGYTLDRKNPIYREFALSLHGKGISAIAFSAGLDQEELVLFQELIMMRDGPSGNALHNAAIRRGLNHIQLHPIELSSFCFQEDNKQEASKRRLWEDYIYGLLQGKLSSDEAEEIVNSIPPEEIGAIMNELMTENSPDASYERMVKVFLVQRGPGSNAETRLANFRLMIDSLKPSLKVEFLKKAIALFPSMERLESLLSTLNEEETKKLLDSLNTRDSVIPETLRNFLRKVGKVAPDGESRSDMTEGEKSTIDDFEVDERVLKLLEEDNFKTFVDEQYRSDLRAMLKSYRGQGGSLARKIQTEVGDAALNRSFSGVIYELLEISYLQREDREKLMSQLSETAIVFLQTGRFRDICEMYSVVRAKSAQDGVDGHDSNSNLFFLSQTFIAYLVDSLRQWGRFDREGALMIAQLLRDALVDPLLDALANESDSTKRKFILQLLINMGKEVLPAAVKWLRDPRWFVVRNILYIIREAGGREYESDVRRFVDNSNTKIRVEALKSLLSFKGQESFSHLRAALGSDDPEIKQQAIALCGSYRVKESVEQLVELLRKKDIFGRRSKLKMTVVRALGQIGDEKAIEPLIKLYGSMSLFSPATQRELRIEIFKNLSGYQQDAAKQLITLGLKSGVREIREFCENRQLRVPDVMHNEDV